MPLELAPSVARLLEVQHVAHRLSTSPEFVRRLIRERKLKAIRMGRRWRIDPIDLEEFINRQRTTVKTGRRDTDLAPTPPALH